MLIYFKVGNYKSFKEPVVISFAAAPISEHRGTNVNESKRLNLLKSVLLYGHNASGKSKLVEALLIMRWLVLTSANEHQDGDIIPVEAFALDPETEKQPTFFEISFLLGEQAYRYGFESDKNKIYEEWLFESKTGGDNPLFLRMNDRVQIQDPKRFENADGLEKRMRSNALFLSVASQWNVPKAAEILSWFRKIIPVNALDDELHKRTTLELLKDEEMAKEVVEFIKRADIGIDSLEAGAARLFRKAVKGAPPDPASVLLDDDYPVVFTWHQKFDSAGNPAGRARFLLEDQESAGTQKFFNLVGVFIRAIRQNQILVVDELNAQLHSLLTKAILRLFNSDSTNSKAQLLATSHDTALLDRDLLRRDQIYFVEKDKFGASGLTSLAEYDIRKEAPFDKNYLEGRFGAIPFIDEFETIIKNG